MTASVPARPSIPLAIAAPATETPRPAQVARGSRWPCSVEMRACQTGWVATRAVAMATLVIRVLDMKVA